MSGGSTMYVVLQSFHERLGPCVVVRIAFLGARLMKDVIVEDLHVCVAKILNASVRMMDYAALWLSTLNRHLERVGRKRAIHSL